jgi:hypothetical protein
MRIKSTIILFAFAALLAACSTNSSDFTRSELEYKQQGITNNG